MTHPAGAGRRPVSVCIAFGELSVDIEADGLYSPDSIHDLVGQAIRGFNEALAYLKAHGIASLDAEVVEDDDETDD
ncbi:MAG TPA: hypothetical protein VIG24_02035 [Acidimicrobiia bacterium]|jgi:hypothetical protein